jgi:hypothetical protein
MRELLTDGRRLVIWIPDPTTRDLRALIKSIGRHAHGCLRRALGECPGDYWLRGLRSQSITARESSRSADEARAGALLGADSVCGGSRRSALGVTGAIA